MPNYRKIFIAVLLTGMLFPDASVAQEQVPSVMSLHDCMEYAVSNSTAMRIQAADRNDEQWLRNRSQPFQPDYARPQRLTGPYRQGPSYFTLKIHCYIQREHIQPRAAYYHFEGRLKG